MLTRRAVLFVTVSHLILLSMLIGSVRIKAVVGATQTSTVVINEYLADPPDGMAGDANGDGTRDSTQDEFVELVNSGSVPLNIGGFTISDSTQVRFTIPPGKIIPAGEAAVVFGGGNPQGPFGNAAANGLVFTVGGSGLSLNNAGDSILVRDPQGATVASVTFGSAEGNANQSMTRSPDMTGGFLTHSTAQGSGGALFSPGARVNGMPFTDPLPAIRSISPGSVPAGSEPVQLTVDGGNFQSGAQVRANTAALPTTFISSSRVSATVPVSIVSSPGSYAITVVNPNGALSNSVIFTVLQPVVLSAVGINEFLADPPDGAAGDANGDGNRDSSQDEFVEVVNRTDTSLNVGGYTIGDSTQVRFTFPVGTIIPAGEAAVIFGGGVPRGDFGNAWGNGLVFVAALSLNNSGDTIILKDGNGTVVESVSFSAAHGNANQSANRDPDIIGPDFNLHSLVDGSGGRLFSPGAQVSGLPFTPGPRITGIFPERVQLSTNPFTLAVRGSGFDPGAAVWIDLSPVDTTRVSDDELTATVPSRIASVAGAHSVQVMNEGGNRSNIAFLTVVPPPPALFFLQPRYVQVGESGLNLLLQGANFEPLSSVLVEGSQVATRFISKRELGATVPAVFLSSTGSRRVLVQNSDGQRSGELAFEVIPPQPRIASIVPSQAQAGGPAFMLSVKGLNFITDSKVLLDRVTLDTRTLSSTELLAEVPSSLIAEPGLKSIRVLGSDGSFSNEVALRVVAIAPVVESLEPSAVIEGGGEQTLIVRGDKFQAGAKVRVVDEAQLGPHLETTFVGERRLEVRMPPLFTQAAGRVTLRVENPDFGVSNQVSLNVLIKDALVINEFLADPPEGLAGDANGDGRRSSSQDEFIEIVNRSNDHVDVSGYKLSDGEAVRHVFASRTIIPPFEAAVVFGGGAPMGAFGNAAENSLVFVASTGTLSLGNSGDTLTLENREARLVQQIKYGASGSRVVQSLNREPDVDGATFVPHSGLTTDGRLFSPGMRATGASFTVKPRLASISPQSAPVGSAELVIGVSGAGFLPGAHVLFGDATLETQFRSPSELEARLLPGFLIEGGAVEVRVLNPKRAISGSIRFLIVDEPPRIRSVSPDKTSTGAEDLAISIEGERFQRTARVRAAGEPVETTFIRHDPATSSLVAVLPSRFFQAARDLPVQVLNADGNESNTVTIAIDNGPLITRLDRRRIKAGGGDTELAVGGVAFKPGLVLFVNDRAVPTTNVSETSLLARIPALMIAVPGYLMLQARALDGGRSNRVTIRVVE